MQLSNYEQLVCLAVDKVTKKHPKAVIFKHPVGKTKMVLTKVDNTGKNYSLGSGPTDEDAWLDAWRQLEGLDKIPDPKPFKFRIKTPALEVEMSPTTADTVYVRAFFVKQGAVSYQCTGFPAKNWNEAMQKLIEYAVVRHRKHGHSVDTLA